jgi:hypothetical protein
LVSFLILCKPSGSADKSQEAKDDVQEHATSEEESANVAVQISDDGEGQEDVEAKAIGDQGNNSVENYTFDQEIARRELASMIVLHEYTLSMVDHTGFHGFVTALQTLFKMVTRNTIRYALQDLSIIVMLYITSIYINAKFDSRFQFYRQDTIDNYKEERKKDGN